MKKVNANMPNFLSSAVSEDTKQSSSKIDLESQTDAFTKDNLENISEADMERLKLEKICKQADDIYEGVYDGHAVYSMLKRMRGVSNNVKQNSGEPQLKKCKEDARINDSLESHIQKFLLGRYNKSAKKEDKQSSDDLSLNMVSSSVSAPENSKVVLKESSNEAKYEDHAEKTPALNSENDILNDVLDFEM